MRKQLTLNYTKQYFHEGFPEMKNRIERMEKCIKLNISINGVENTSVEFAI